MTPVPILDTHVHFWDRHIDGLSWPWLDPEFRSARHAWTRAAGTGGRDFRDATRYTAEEFGAETKGLGVLGFVHVHSASSDDAAEETAWLDGVAVADGGPLAIVGKVDLAAPQGGDLLRRHRAASERCRGVRDMKGRDGLDPAACAATLAVAAELGFSVELRTEPEGFGTLAALADQWPDVTFVLSHAALPRSRNAATLEQWTVSAAELAARPNWICKISALCGGSDPDWTVDSIRPWALACLAVFGPDRCMLGTNWPVDRLFGTYGAVVGAYREIFAHLEGADSSRIFHGTALDVYGIAEADAGPSRG